DNLERFREGYIQSVHPFSLENVHGASKRCRNRWDKNGIATILELLDDKCWDQGFFDLNQCRFPYIFSTLARNLLGEAAYERVAGDSLKEGCLELLAKHPSGPSPDGKADQEANHEHKDERESLLGWKPVREQEGERPHQTCDRFHALKQQQDREINWKDNEQAAKQCASNEQQ